MYFTNRVKKNIDFGNYLKIIKGGEHSSANPKVLSSILGSVSYRGH